MKAKGVAERRARTWTRQEEEGGERKKRSGPGTRQQPNLELQQHLIIYQWKVRHILQKIIVIQYHAQFLSSPYKN